MRVLTRRQPVDPHADVRAWAVRIEATNSDEAEIVAVGEQVGARTRPGTVKEIVAELADEAWRTRASLLVDITTPGTSDRVVITPDGDMVPATDDLLAVDLTQLVQISAGLGLHRPTRTEQPEAAASRVTLPGRAMRALAAMSATALAPVARIVRAIPGLLVTGGVSVARGLREIAINPSRSSENRRAFQITMLIGCSAALGAAAIATSLIGY